MPSIPMQVIPLAGAVGAEISGVDLTQGVTPDLAAALRAVFLKHQVIVLRRQPLTLDGFMHFARAMGTPVEYPFVKGLDGYPHIIEVKKLADERVNFGGIWHSDTTYLPQPPMGSMLLARELPPVGGDTLFASQYAAYEALSDTMQRLLQGLRGISSSAKADVSKTREDRLKSDGKGEGPRSYTSSHPIIRTHPETGRHALYVNIAHTAGIEGLSEAESAPLLAFLFAHQVKPEFTCRVAWEPDMLTFWDNRCVQHNPVNDYHGYKRLMHRITLQGDTPV